MTFQALKIAPQIGTSFGLVAFLWVVAGAGAGCGAVSQTGDASATGGTTGGSAGVSGSAGATHGAAGASGGSAGGMSGSAGSAGSAGAHGGNDGGAGSAGSAGAHGGSDGGAAGKDGGECICNAIYSPVCGVDGKTYPNVCNAACAGVAVAHTGACATASDAGTDGSIPLGYCDQSSDCVARSTGACSCTQTCAAKTDPLPPKRAYTCLIACPLIVLDCGCVNHKCTAGATTAASP